MKDVLELCCFEWFQNHATTGRGRLIGFRAMLFRMVPKPTMRASNRKESFRAMLFRMVPKHFSEKLPDGTCFRAMLFRMVPKPI